MRIDRYLGLTGCCTRTEAKKIIRAGGVTVNGVAIRSADAKLDPEEDKVVFCGAPVTYRKYTYILMCFLSWGQLLLLPLQGQGWICLIF